MKKLLVLISGLLAAAAGTWFIGMRTGWRPVVDTQRRLNRRFANPRMLARVGEPGGPTAVVHHTGRRSGAEYRTPVSAVRTEDGFAIASVYGTGSDWIRNVLAGGPTGIEMDGRIVAVQDPRIVPIAEVERFFSTGDRRAHRIFGVGEALRLRAAA